MALVRRHQSKNKEKNRSDTVDISHGTSSGDGENIFSIIVLGNNVIYKKALELIIGEKINSKLIDIFELIGCSTVGEFPDIINNMSDEKRDSMIILLLDDGGDPASTIKNLDFLKKINPSHKIIVLSSSKNSDYIGRCIEKGIDAYLFSNMSEDLLIDCMTLVAHDQSVFPSQSFRHNFETDLEKEGSGPNTNRKVSLTGMEEKDIKVLSCLASGMSNKEISRITGLSDPATKLAVRKLLSKIGAKNRVQAAVWAQQNGYGLDL
jgi:two-component system nitrate/nitrite response regulator NarL